MSELDAERWQEHPRSRSGVCTRLEAPRFPLCSRLHEAQHSCSRSSGGTGEYVQGRIGKNLECLFQSVSFDSWARGGLKI